MFTFLKNIFSKESVDDFYWKYVDIDLELMKEIQNIYSVYNHKPTQFFESLDIIVPDIMGRRIVIAALVYCPAYSNPIFAHKDPEDHLNGSSSYALNIPLINCDNSLTTLYKDKKKKIVLPKGYSGADLHLQAVHSAIPITSYVLDRPILFNTRVFHAVQNFSNKPRLAISLRFDKNPIDWISS